MFSCCHPFLRIICCFKFLSPKQNGASRAGPIRQSQFTNHHIRIYTANRCQFSFNHRGPKGVSFALCFSIAKGSASRYVFQFRFSSSKSEFALILKTRKLIQFCLRPARPFLRMPYPDCGTHEVAKPFAPQKLSLGQRLADIC